MHAKSGLILPLKEGITLQNPFTRFLNNLGGIRNALQQGDALAGPAIYNSDQTKISRAWTGEKRAKVEII